MQLTVLVDNNTLIDRYLVGEPGVSYLIEHDGQKSFSIPDIRMFFCRMRKRCKLI
jgi:hypothetical protein